MLITQKFLYQNGTIVSNNTLMIYIFLTTSNQFDHTLESSDRFELVAERVAYGCPTSICQQIWGQPSQQSQLEPNIWNMLLTTSQMIKIFLILYFLKYFPYIWIWLFYVKSTVMLCSSKARMHFRLLFIWIVTFKAFIYVNIKYFWCNLQTWFYKVLKGANNYKLLFLEIMFEYFEL